MIITWDKPWKCGFCKLWCPTVKKSLIKIPLLVLSQPDAWCIIDIYPISVCLMNDWLSEQKLDEMLGWSSKNRDIQIKISCLEVRYHPLCVWSLWSIFISGSSSYLAVLPMQMLGRVWNSDSNIRFWSLMQSWLITVLINFKSGKIKGCCSIRFVFL